MLYHNTDENGELILKYDPRDDEGELTDITYDEGELWEGNHEETQEDKNARVTRELDEKFQDFAKFAKNFKETHVDDYA